MLEADEALRDPALGVDQEVATSAELAPSLLRVPTPILTPGDRLGLTRQGTTTVRSRRVSGRAGSAIGCRAPCLARSRRTRGARSSAGGFAYRYGSGRIGQGPGHCEDESSITASREVASASLGRSDVTLNRGGSRASPAREWPAAPRSGLAFTCLHHGELLAAHLTGIDRLPCGEAPSIVIAVEAQGHGGLIPSISSSITTCDPEQTSRRPRAPGTLRAVAALGEQAQQQTAARRRFFSRTRPNLLVGFARLAASSGLRGPVSLGCLAARVGALSRPASRAPPGSPPPARRYPRGSALEARGRLRLRPSSTALAVRARQSAIGYQHAVGLDIGDRGGFRREADAARRRELRIERAPPSGRSGPARRLPPLRRLLPEQRASNHSPYPSEPAGIAVAASRVHPRRHHLIGAASARAEAPSPVSRATRITPPRKRPGSGRARERAVETRI